MKKRLIVLFIMLLILILGTQVYAVSLSILADELNVRQKPSTDSETIGVLGKGEKVDLISEEDDWYKIFFNNSEGYISKKYAEKELEDSSKDEENIERTKKISYELKNDVDLYILPLLNSTKIAIVSKDTKINVISNNGKWLYIQTDTNSGWIITNQTVEGSKNDNNKQENEEENKIDTENNKEEQSTTNNTTNEEENATKNSTKEETNTETNKEETKTSSDDEYPITMYVNTDSVNIRSSANISSSVISGSTKNASLKVIGKEGDWYKVSTEDGIGYIKGEFLSKSSN